ncbi:MAG: hypothetical protein HRS51_02900 [Candidatus Nitrosopelagicus sp.]|nr:hypothetical protein [Candidatus Nitrosopelagicus sp.]
MEINTVVISLDRLKELELSEKKANELRSKTVVIERYRGVDFIVSTDDECDEKLAYYIKTQEEQLKTQEDEFETQQEEIEKLKTTIENLELKIGYVNEMNYWDFRKWKKS